MRRSGWPPPRTGGRSSSTLPWRRCSATAARNCPRAPGGAEPAAADGPDPADVEAIAGLLARASRPVLVLGSDVWLTGAETAAREAACELRLPVVANGQGRGILPAGHELLVTRARSAAFGAADLVLVAGTPLDFRLGYGEFGGRDGNAPAQVVHVADSPGQPRHPSRPRRLRRRGPHALLHDAGRGGPQAMRQAGAAARPGRTPGCPGSRPRPATRSRPTRRCWPATPTRCTRCASTANWPGCSTTTPW